MDHPPATAALPALRPPGLVVNVMKGDADEHRAGAWLEWNGQLDGLRAALIGVPFDGASVVRTGSRGGPDAVRLGLVNYTTFSSADGRGMEALRAADIGDVLITLTDMATSFDRVTETAAALVRRGIVPVSIGGDHSIAYPLIRGVTQGLRPGAKLGIIHFDAHHDLRAAHLGAESSGVPFRKALETLPDAVHGQNLVQIGMAEFTNSRQFHDYAADHGITVIPGRGLRHGALLAAVERALEIAGQGTDAIYVSVDIDCIDQAQAPGTAAPNPFGLDLRDVQEALRLIGAHPKAIGMDLVEISPSFDHDNMTGRAGASLILSFLYGLAARG
ncbi:agmatinase family protein [Humitalea sp. 24SJ18S-53]|uniref:agmatinase family protein n=1 Tax=Humitalea sp. 24SJ18S-53 TaxID=3422307 RepID=UPI003D67A54D